MNLPKQTKKIKSYWLLLLPSLSILIITVLLPVFRTFFYSLQNYKLTEPHKVKYIGFKNYIKVFQSADFYYALKNSAIILLLVLIIAFTLSIAIGVLLSKKSKFSPLLTAVAIIPWALPPLVNGIIWKFIFYPGYGLMNKILLALHLIEQPIAWGSSLFSTFFVVAFVVAWRVIPFCALLVLATIQHIPQDIYETSKVDGATKWQSFKSITLPFLLPSMAIMLTKITMAGINVFDEVIAIVGFKLEASTLLIYNYMNIFTYLDFGFGSAITYVVMILSGLAGLLYIKDITKEV